MMTSLEAYSTDHCHPQRREPSNTTRNTFAVVSVVCLLFLIAEIVGGILSNSLALLTDAAHLASDLASFAISLFAMWLSKKPTTKTMSFGYHRAEIFGAMASVLSIWIVTAILVYFAIQRVIYEDYEINADTMLITSSLGILFNIIMGVLLNFNVCTRCRLDIGHGHSHGFGSSHGHSHGLISANQTANDYQAIEGGQDDEEASSKQKNILLQAAFVHVVGDLIQSIGVFVAAIIIKCRPDLVIVDPICTFLFSVLVMCTTFNVLRDTTYVLMEAVPRNVDLLLVKKDLQSINGVRSAHSLHIWALTLDKNAVIVHLAVDEGHDSDSVLRTATGVLRTKYNMYETHVQTEQYQPDIMESCERCVA